MSTHLSTLVFTTHLRSNLCALVEGLDSWGNEKQGGKESPSRYHDGRLVAQCPRSRSGSGSCAKKLAIFPFYANHHHLITFEFE